MGTSCIHEKLDIDERRRDKEVFIQVMDAAGNIATAGDSINYYSSQSGYAAAVDKSPPVIKDFRIANGASVVRTSSIPLSIVAIDDMGVSNLKMRFSKDGVTWTPLVNYSMRYTLTGLSFSTGYNILYIEVVDAANNSDRAQLSFFYYP